MAETVLDPVCGMEVRAEEAAASEEHDGGTFYFCTEACHQTSSPIRTATGIDSRLLGVAGRV